ncbi:MAG: hypothetical protein P8X98_14135 [Woeseiaceae bacterium]|jgi:hypothetical protein
MNRQMQRDHWLARPENVKRLWRGFWVVLALTVVAQFVIPIKGHFGIDGWFGFGAVYGFLSCLAMVLVAKVLGFLLKRDEDYYTKGGYMEETGVADD